MSNPEISLNNSDNSTSNRWRILENYDKEQEKEVESAVHFLENGATHRDFTESAEEVRNRFEKEKIEKQPTRLQKIGREILAATFGVPKAIKEKQEREAMPAALAEFDKQQAQKKENARIQKEQQDREEEVQRQQIEQKRVEKELEIERKDRDELAEEMIKGMDKQRKKKLEDYRKERMQEIVERELESQLTKVDELEEQSFVGGSGVEKRSVEYGDGEIDVYDLNGYPFSMLSHAVDFQFSDGDALMLQEYGGVKEAMEHGLRYNGRPGWETAAKLFLDPSEWDNGNGVASNFGRADQRANVLSVSLVRSWGKNKATRVAKKLCYGFGSITGGRLINVYVGDGMTKANYGSRSIGIEKLDAIDKALEKGHEKSYNELLLHRYSDNGEALRPDYIIAENGKIDDNMKKHAAYFGIPIVNINLDYYEEANKNE